MQINWCIGEDGVFKMLYLLSMFGERNSILVSRGSQKRSMVASPEMGRFNIWITCLILPHHITVSDP